ncbi:MAG TPA: hypothetical protein VJU86_16050 [Pyrinomonadaceae bacterium]|nr:hypothetical protein [Pyrinomonadaceae bacterium]
MGLSKWNSNTVSDLIIEVWEALDCDSVGKTELEEIQKVLGDKFGPGGVSSPATIARAVADEGAVLRHPEVFECDYNWRLRRLSSDDLLGALNFSNLSEAVTSFGRIEEKRHAIGTDGEQLKLLREIMVSARQDVLLSSQSKILSAAQREEAEEVFEWLNVWLRSPQLFPDWLDLRMRTEDFKRKFRS